MHSYKVNKPFLCVKLEPWFASSVLRNLKFWKVLLGNPEKVGGQGGEGIKKVFLLKQSVKAIETDLQKILYL